MFQTIVLTTDFSTCARTAYPFAADLARQFGATVQLVHEVEELPPLYAVREDASAARYGELAERLEAETGREELEGFDLEAKLCHVGGVHDTLIDFLTATRPDLVVIASHGRSGVSRWLLGSFAERVTRLSPVPILVHRQGERPIEFHPKRILIPCDFSANAQTAFPLARELASHYGAALKLVHVFPAPDALPYGRLASGLSQEEIGAAVRGDSDKTEKALEELRAREFHDLDASVRARVGNPALEIACEAKETDTDLVVMSTHGFTGLRHLFHGSVAERVLRAAPCSVLIVRPESVVSGHAAG